MWYWSRNEATRRVSLLVQRAVEEGPCAGKGASWRAEGWLGEIARAVEPRLTASSFVFRDTSERGSGGNGRSVLHWGLCVLAAVLLAGCAEVTPREEGELKQATAEELTTLLRQRQAAIDTMKGLFSAKVRGGIIPIATRVEGTVYFQQPNAMRMRGFTAIGSELFEFVQANDHFILRLPTMGRVLSGSPTDMSEMGKLARPFQLSVWAMGGVLGTSAVATNETVKLVEEGDQYRFEVSGPSPNGALAIQRRLWFDRRTMLVVKEDRLSDAGDVEATIQYEDFRQIGDLNGASGHGNASLLRPFKVSLEDGKGQGSVQVTFHEIIPNQPLKPGDLGHV